MIQNYITYLSKIRGYSQNTTIAYEKDIRAFASWMREYDHNARWSTISREDIDAYIIYRNNQGAKPSTTNRALAAISGLYRYLKREGYEINNPCQYESRRKIGSTIPNTIQNGSLRVAYKNAKGVAKFMLGILMTTGIRIQEMLDLRWQDVNFEEYTLRINGKGSKQRIVYTTEEVLAKAKEIRQYARPDMRMFWLNQRQTRALIYSALKPYCRANQLSPHAIRHSFATELAKQGANVATISNLLGHNSIKTTQKYIDMTQVSTKEAARKLHMLN